METNTTFPILSSSAGTSPVGTTATRDRRFYAKHITNAWKQVIAATRTFGMTLVSSRIDLPPDEWREFITVDCPFDLTVGCKILKLAQGPQMSDVGMSEACCFCEILGLPETVFRYGVDHDFVTAACSPEDVAALKKHFKVEKTLGGGEGNANKL